MASRKRRLQPPEYPGSCGTSSELQAAAEKLERGAAAEPRVWDSGAATELQPRVHGAATELQPRFHGAAAEPRDKGAAAEPQDHGATCTEHFHACTASPRRLLWDFFRRPCVALARECLGQVMVRRLADGTEVRGRIVETEAYLGGEDYASHSRGGRRSLRNAAMFMSPGTLYVYQIYGLYFCLNLSSEGDGAAVLVRSLEPLQGLDTMRGLRSKRRKAGGKPLKDHQLCNGPSKLCQALDITKSFDQEHLATTTDLWMERGPQVIAGTEIISSSRIGIGYAGEWVSKPLRFYIKNNKCVSVIDRKAEAMND
ncbi:DNA-3-methyladenine glycosylase [Amblyraja radiata]|uniref:DNA-3-methyladenine glycosylase n=1 Tax=Amblyraja radiata TaxID=386614 RepID=UPI001404239E|nr:DNA-3-methyladenine glycosylase [Amblyraja radiata]